ncbi:UDP-3-O-acylglucosamine N-acyltransferase [Camelimonas fluminis]|uniref:UDP-3-O-acylglucosamine N-acyltransferase n=1 Tax=Camelimonas fluminis TaxID=1576911 RepID=A0ABV7UFH8_9HYPH|nr:UDP-3-O-(3-hydroxymyristoyl)glucosamine N-acyltransferase [Camelimonas fluminis]GHE52354.1 UDP-3-O-acylglucosamine N-acyltransferase [Camelimonas fluminis]
MTDPVFFRPVRGIALQEVAALAGVPLPEGVDPSRIILGVAPLESAGPDELSYMDNARYVAQLGATRAGVVLVADRYAPRVGAGSVAIVCKDPHRAYARVLAELFPDAMRPGSFFGASGVAPGAIVHPDARIEQGAVIDPGAVIGAGAEVGRGTVIGATSVVGPGVRIGRDCSIAPGVVLQHALLGNRVIIHPGARVGQDGFGFAMGGSHLKLPQIGRVIIQDDVEIGANTTVDRGATRDTMIGEGTKIDNLVQIAHNVVIGRHCVIVSQVGIAGSSTIEDYVVIGGQVGVIGHVRVGAGSQIAATSNVNSDVPPGSIWGGTPARPVKEWFREIAALKKLASRDRNK